MRTIFFLFFLSLASPIFASERFAVQDVGVSIEFPDGWYRDTKDAFGTVLHPPDHGRRKVRIHLTTHQGDLQKALQESEDFINAKRAKRDLPPERILRLAPITTKSGLQGMRATRADGPDDKAAYLDTYYFTRPKGAIFCVCVYFYGDEAFAKECETWIANTLRLTK